MCGIAGYVQRADSAKADLNSMLRRIAHRGPDGSGVWYGASGAWTVALGHRRLAIIDLAGGAQPMANEDERVHITFNGEIYNFRELRSPLERRGHRFRTRCDTEAIVHHFEQYGVDGLADLNGMFAFAIWDESNASLTLVRDRVGIKPLYYAPLPDGGVAFASELTSLLEHYAVDRTLDPQGMASLFFRDYAAAPGTLVTGAYKLEPGHLIVWSAATGLQPSRPYWSLYVRSGTANPGNQIEQLRKLLETAVESQLVADVPIGVFLSGGIDSSLVAALAQKKSQGRISTFSIGFDDPDYDESEFARVAAQHIGSEHTEQRFSERDLMAVLDPALSSLDEPMGDPSILPTFLVSRLAATKVKVVLGGDGGDELWAGYPTYRAHQLAPVYAAVPPAFRSLVLEPTVRCLPVRHAYQSLEWKLKRFVLRWNDEPFRRHEQWMSGTLQEELDEAIAGPRRHSVFSGEVARRPDLINEMLAFDFRNYLPGSVLSKVDRASMAHGLEVRPPLLENRLIEFAFSLPSSLKLCGRESKWLLKQVARDLLPREIIHRRKKGFAVPLARWMATTLKPTVDRLLRESPVWDHRILNRCVFARWAEQHVRREADRSRPLWSLVVLDHWLRRMGS